MNTGYIRIKNLKNEYDPEAVQFCSENRIWFSLFYLTQHLLVVTDV